MHRMTTSDLEITVPFTKEKLMVVVDLDDHPALKLLQSPALKKIIEEACLASYREEVAFIGMNPSLPRIRKASEVWKHLKFKSVRFDTSVADRFVLHVVPEWDIDEQMEICIEGDQLVFAGQFLDYGVSGY